MKAFLLAAGLGTRLRPLTDTLPKCLVEIAGKPLLHWWIKLFERHGITEVLINLHHLPEKVEEYLRSYKGEIQFQIVHEIELLGSAGTISENKQFVTGERNFLIAYADNLTNYNLSQMNSFHLSHTLPFSMALFETDIPKQKGIAYLNNDQTVIEFVEKPSNPKTNLANAGIYICNSEVIDLIPKKLPCDIGYDLLPLLVGNMKGWKTNGFLMDIGTIVHLEKAQKLWKDNNEEE